MDKVVKCMECNDDIEMDSDEALKHTTDTGHNLFELLVNPLEDALAELELSCRELEGACHNLVTTLDEAAESINKFKELFLKNGG